MPRSREVVNRVLSILAGRAGFDDWWYDVDRDIQKEILDELTEEIAVMLNGRNLENAFFTTYTGKQFKPFNPDPEDITLEDIAHALSLQGRFNGHTRVFYSIAQHSVYVASLVPPEDQLHALLHDGPEAYLGDVVKPLKNGLKRYQELEEVIEKMVYERFGLNPVMPPSVKKADLRILYTEARDLLINTDGWTILDEPVEYRIRPWSASAAEASFLYTWDLVNRGGYVQLTPENLIFVDPAKTSVNDFKIFTNELPKGVLS